MCVKTEVGARGRIEMIKRVPVEGLPVHLPKITGAS